MSHRWAPRAQSLVAAAVAVQALACTGCGWLDLAELREGDGASNLLSGGLPSPAEAARMATDEFDPNRRYRGMLLLANAPFAGEDVYIRAFEAATTDADEGVRAAGARGLANHGSPRHATELALLLDDSSELVRLEAARGLQRLHNPVVVDALLARLAERADPAAAEARPGERRLVRVEPSEAVRAEAADALGQYREVRVVEALIAALDDPDLSVNRNALRSLWTLTGQRDLPPDRRRWVAWLETAREPSAVLAQGSDYQYPVFTRGKYLYEYIPLPIFPPAPIETPASPAGYPKREDGLNSR